MRSAPRLVPLKPSHFVILLTWVALVVFISANVWSPGLAGMYASEIGLPAMEKRYGFTYGKVRTPLGYMTDGIVALDRDGLLAQRGLQLHDAPWDGHWAFYEALLAVDRGEAASIAMVNLDDWGMLPRRIEIPARR
jgi:hypothetical protein